MPAPEVHLFLPQMRMTFEALEARAVAAEAAGFGGIALMDHLAPPLAEDRDLFEAMVTATWLAARTETLRVGHLVLCDSFRHPAVLAKQAVSIDHASGGRFDLGIGWGSVPDEIDRFGVGATDTPARVERLAETLEVVRALWSGEPVEFAGRHHRVAGGRQRPRPRGDIPIVVGGAGPRTLALVARHATWWNCPIYAVDRLEELRRRAGDARVSVQEVVGLVVDESRRDAVASVTARRFGAMGPGVVVGTADEVVAHLRALRRRGVERVYTWFSDFADPATLAAFGNRVIAEL